MTTPHYQPPQPFPGGGPQWQPPKPGGDKKLVGLLIGLSIVLVLVLGALVWAVIPGDDPAPRAGQPGPGKSVLDQDGPLTEADLAQLDPGKLLDETLRAMMIQPAQHTRQERIWFGQVAAYLTGAQYRADIVEGAFDYPARKYAYHADDALCTDGKKFRLSGGAWQDDGSCGSPRPLDLIKNVGNGLVPSGLTEQQADAFLGKMRGDYAGFLNAGKPALADHDGKQYVRLPVVFRSLEIGGSRYGAQIFIFGFRATGLGWEQHPFTVIGSTEDQVEGVLYVDPKTRLPAYSELLCYDPKDDPAGGDGQIRRVEYFWDREPPRFDQASVEPPPLPSWPAEKLKPEGK
ncbi:hypothetical protein [Amycolatopsis anabasis]|uniref:hypothetical protein n=1 Tax=Amycolatopsis anabasis TaxID=1840409 RepID=UPI00131DDF3F|nr:hypothetical protein [Amycolatopsis anabasis]